VFSNILGGKLWADYLSKLIVFIFFGEYQKTTRKCLINFKKANEYALDKCKYK